MFQRFFYALLLLLLSLPTHTFAHDTSFATLKIIRINPTSWAFELKTPLYGLDQSVRKLHAQNPDNLKNLVAGTNKYKALIVAYIKKEFDVTAWTVTKENSHSKAIKLSLGQGRMQLNNHLSTLIFEIKGMPEATDKLVFKLPYMSHNESQHNILRLIDGERNTRHILSFSNDFSATETSFFNTSTHTGKTSETSPDLTKE